MLHALVFVVLLASRGVQAENRELLPLEAPANLTLLEIQSRQIVIQWSPVSPRSLRGNFQGYLIRTWNRDGSKMYAVLPDENRARVEFFPYSINFVAVAAKNDKFVGPQSEAISFDAPQIEPNRPQFVNVHPLGEKSVIVRWAKPARSNGILTGFKIYYWKSGGDGAKSVKSIEIFDPDKLQAKINGLDEGVEYKVEVAAVNCVGEGESEQTSIVLEPHITMQPDPPKFTYKINYTLHKTQNNRNNNHGNKEVVEDPCYKSDYKPLTSSLGIEQSDDVADEAEEEEKPEYDYYDYFMGSRNNKTKTTTTPRYFPATAADKEKPMSNDSCIVDYLVTWLPELSFSNPGGYFYLKYKKQGDDEYVTTEPEMENDFTILEHLNSCINYYSIIMVVVDGEFSSESNEIITPTKLPQ